MDAAVISNILAGLAIIVTIGVVYVKTNKTIQNGIKDKLHSIDKCCLKNTEDIGWIKDKFKELPCVKDPEKYFSQHHPKL